MTRYAEISTCGAYRYRLERTWDCGLPRCAWICLNPSTADDQRDDPTVRKIIGFSSRWGYGGFALFNVLALRSADPRTLLTHDAPRGPGNEPWRIAQWCDAVSPDWPILAWGAVHKRFEIMAMECFAALPKQARCLGYTKDGNPRHPLMLPYSTRLEIFRPLAKKL